MKHPPLGTQNGLFIGEGGGGVLLVWGWAGLNGLRVG